MSDKKKKDRIRPSDIPPVANAFAGAVGGAIGNLVVSVYASWLIGKQKLMSSARYFLWIW
jgi:branched-subunit amino acid ABC-type transport system permease component